MHPLHLTDEELVMLPQVRNDLTELELVALTRLHAALDEIDALARAVEEGQSEDDLG
jgi:hypothetical protein